MPINSLPTFHCAQVRADKPPGNTEAWAFGDIPFSEQIDDGAGHSVAFSIGNFRYRGLIRRFFSTFCSCGNKFPMVAFWHKVKYIYQIAKRCCLTK